MRQNGSDQPPSLEDLDSEEVRIFRKSIPAEAVTRDFLEELLQEHQASRAPGANPPGSKARQPSA